VASLGSSPAANAPPTATLPKTQINTNNQVILYLNIARTSLWLALEMDLWNFRIVEKLKEIYSLLSTSDSNTDICKSKYALPGQAGKKADKKRLIKTP
jgi:hypothetical protein